DSDAGCVCEQPPPPPWLRGRSPYVPRGNGVHRRPFLRAGLFARVLDELFEAAFAAGLPRLAAERAPAVLPRLPLEPLALEAPPSPELLRPLSGLALAAPSDPPEALFPAGASPDGAGLESPLLVSSDLAAGSSRSAMLRLLSLSDLKSVSYQPPPFRRNTGAETSFFSAFFPQEGHFSSGGSEIFC